VGGDATYERLLKVCGRTYDFVDIGPRCVLGEGVLLILLKEVCIGTKMHEPCLFPWPFARRGVLNRIDPNR
jgi:hypothetical protein